VELVTQARQLTTDGHPGDTVLWERIAERVAGDDHVHDPELGPEARLRAELAEQRAFAAYGKERLADGNTAMAEAAELFERDAGLRWYALAARARVGSFAWRSAEAAEGADSPATDSSPSWSDLDAVLREAEELLAAATPGMSAPGAPEKYLTVLHCRAFAAHTEAVAELPDISAATRARFESLTGAVVSEAARLEVPHLAVGVRMYTADIAARSGRTDEAVAELRTALDILETTGRPWRTPRLEAQLGQVLLQQDKPAEAVASLRQALAGATRFDDTSFPAARTYLLLGHACSHAGDLPGAVRHLSEAASRFDRDGDDNAAAEARLQLADVLGRSGQEADAVAVLESLVVDDASAGLGERLLAQIRLSLARGLRNLEEHQASAEQFLRLADTVAAWEEQDTHTMVASQAAVALARADRWDAARAAYERALISHRKSPQASLIAEMMREFAAVTMASEGSDGLEAALGHLAEADELRAAVPEDAEDFVHWYQAGATCYRRARALSTAERFAEALAEMERAVSAYEEGGSQGEIPRAEAVRVAALIEANGLKSPQAATARLDAAVSRCETAGLKQAAKTLQDLRDEFASRRPG
jgi:tetratricopeptide (TPR) repeat protein